MNTFEQYYLQTAKIFVTLYSWYCMPTTVYKILIHDTLIIEWSLLPIVQISEDAQEARHRGIKKYRECFYRTNSRKATM